MNSIERSVVAGLCVLGLLMFVFPIMTIKVPIAGIQTHSGYDVVRNMGNLGDTITGDSGSDASNQTTIQTPVSIRFAFLISIFVAGAFMAVLFTLSGAIWKP